MSQSSSHTSSPQYTTIEDQPPLDLLILPSCISFHPQNPQSQLQTSHLSPSCTYQQYLNLSDTVKDQHDLVSGTLTHNPKMANVDHIDIVKTITYYLYIAMIELNIDLYIYSEAQIYIPSRQHAFQDLKFLSNRPSFKESPPSSPSSSGSAEGKRRSDICVLTSPPRIGRDGFFEKDCIPLLIIEVTSDQSSRATDFNSKWRQYYRAGVQQYLIIDRDQPHIGNSNYKPCVILGHMNKSWLRASTGNPKDCSEPPSTRSASSARDKKYPRKVYDISSDEVIECSYLKMTAREMLRPPMVETIWKNDALRHKNKLQEKERQHRYEVQQKDNQLQEKERQHRYEIQQKDNQLQEKENQLRKAMWELERMKKGKDQSPPLKVRRRRVGGSQEQHEESESE